MKNHLPSHTTLATFQKTVRRFFAKGKRDLPWRHTRDPYHILVSEIMLQQTQVERVIPKYALFLKRFPSIADLANAPLRDVVVLWQGLGYNRRAKLLHEAARQILRDHGGVVPKEYIALRALPGVGPYIAGAVTAFAFNKHAIFIETNIRTVFTHHFFTTTTTVSDQELLPLIEATLPSRNVREWYSALMDYGAYLKRGGIRINAKNTGYTKQSPFKGSSREIRGKIIRELSKGNLRTEALLKKVSSTPVSGRKELTALISEGLVTRKRGVCSLSH